MCRRGGVLICQTLSQVDNTAEPRARIDPCCRVVIRSGSIRYLQEMLERENYIVTCRCTSFRNTSYALAQEVWVGRELRATFECILVLLERDGSGRYPLPDRLKQYFEQTENARPEG